VKNTATKKQQQPKRKMVQVRYNGKQIASNGQIIGWTIREIHTEYKERYKIRESVCPVVNNQQIDDWSCKLESGDKLTFFDAVLITVDDNVICAPFVGKTVREAFQQLKDAYCIDEMSLVNLNSKRLNDADTYLQPDDCVEFIANPISDAGVSLGSVIQESVTMKGMEPTIVQQNVQKLKKSLWSSFLGFILGGKS
jgi:molybdopterin converting factor small subunit